MSPWQLLLLLGVTPPSQGNRMMGGETCFEQVNPRNMTGNTENKARQQDWARHLIERPAYWVFSLFPFCSLLLYCLPASSSKSVGQFFLHKSGSVLLQVGRGHLSGAPVGETSLCLCSLCAVCVRITGSRFLPELLAPPWQTGYIPSTRGFPNQDITDGI